MPRRCFHVLLDDSLLVTTSMIYLTKSCEGLHVTNRNSLNRPSKTSVTYSNCNKTPSVREPMPMDAYFSSAYYHQLHSGIEVSEALCNEMCMTVNVVRAGKCWPAVNLLAPNHPPLYMAVHIIDRLPMGPLYNCHG